MPADRKCLNKACAYYKAGKCKLFPGGAWLNCRRAGIPSKPTPKMGKNDMASKRIKPTRPETFKPRQEFASSGLGTQPC